MKMPAFIAALFATSTEDDKLEIQAWLKLPKNRNIRLPAADPAPIRLRGPDGQRKLVWSLDAMPYLPPFDLGPEPPDKHSEAIAELEDLGFDDVEADFIVAVNYEQCPAKDLCRRLGCDAREVERRAASVRRRIDRMRYKAAVAHEKAFLQRSPVEFRDPWPKD